MTVCALSGVYVGASCYCCPAYDTPVFHNIAFANAVSVALLLLLLPSTCQPVVRVKLQKETRPAFELVIVHQLPYGRVPSLLLLRGAPEHSHRTQQCREHT